MKVMLDRGAFIPTRAHETDAGLDLRAYHSDTVGVHDSTVFRTGVHVQIPKGYCGLLVSKSGLMTKCGITSTGLIDEGYTGEILVKLFNQGRASYKVNAGDKISQLVIIPVSYEPVEVVDYLEPTERGDNGYGSTGK